MRLVCLSRALVRLVHAGIILFAAGLIGAGAMLLLLLLAEAVTAVFTAGSAPFGASILVGIVAFPFWLIGAFVVGPPLWTALHVAGLKGRRTALTAGVLAAGISVPIVLWILGGGGAPSLSPESVGGVALLSAIAGASGALAGEVIHRMAYRSGETIHAR